LPFFRDRFQLEISMKSWAKKLRGGGEGDSDDRMNTEV
jgi:hypothetical protein